ncbi:MAG: hypothetical protein M3Y69_05720 [Verrucomicrobiota bacterium]|nr:hypothetical protein [Verrucomicrobiota bacterium]
MRLLAEIVLIAAIIAVAWDKPFHEWVGDAVPMLAKQSAGADRASSNSAHARRALPATSAAAVQPSATISNGSWMWDKNRKATLDPPKHDHAPPQPTP